MESHHTRGYSNGTPPCYYSENNENPLKWLWRNTHPAGGEYILQKKGEKDGGWNGGVTEDTKKETTIPNKYATKAFTV